MIDVSALVPEAQPIALLPEDETLGRAIRAFYAAVRAHYLNEAMVDGALAVIETGVAFRQAAKAWWERVARLFGMNSQHERP